MSYPLFGAIVAAASVVVSVFFSWLAFWRTSKKDHEGAGENRGVIMSEIGYIKAGIDDLKRDNSEIRRKIEDHETRLARVEESSRQAHKRIDEVKKYDKKE